MITKRNYTVLPRLFALAASFCLSANIQRRVAAALRAAGMS